MIETVLNFFGLNWTMRRVGKEVVKETLMLKASVGLFSRGATYDSIPLGCKVRLHKQLLRDVKTLKQFHNINPEQELKNMISNEILTQVWQQAIKYVIVKAHNDSGFTTTYKTVDTFVEVLKSLDPTKYNIIVSSEIGVYLSQRAEYESIDMHTENLFYCQRIGNLAGISVIIDPYLPTRQIFVMLKDLVDFDLKGEFVKDVLGDIKLNPSLSPPEKGIKFTGELYINTYTGFVVSEIKDIKLK